jgi:hypothetical protein
LLLEVHPSMLTVQRFSLVTRLEHEPLEINRISLTRGPSILYMAPYIVPSGCILELRARATAALSNLSMSSLISHNHHLKVVVNRVYDLSIGKGKNHVSPSVIERNPGADNSICALFKHVTLVNVVGSFMILPSLLFIRPLRWNHFTM